MAVSQIAPPQNRFRETCLQVLPQRNIVAQQTEPITLNLLDNFMKSSTLRSRETDITSIYSPLGNVLVALLLLFLSLFIII